MSAPSSGRPGFPARLPSTAAAARPAAPGLGGTASPPAAAPQGLGLGLDSVAVRRRMVERLAGQGVTHPRVLEAMGAVPRHLFVDRALAPQAYEDTSLPIGHGQTISKPSVVARMLSILCEGLAPRGAEATVLEIGTGCGYQAALLARLFRRVVSVERIQALHQLARRRLDEAGVQGVRLVWGDGRIGHAPWAPYGAIVAAAGGEAVPQVWIDQLDAGGRLVAPVHSDNHRGQVLLALTLQEDGNCMRTVHDLVHFVPLEFGVATKP